MSIYIGGPVEVSDMQGPCPDGFHVPTKDERDGVKTILTGLNITTKSDYSSKLHMPLASIRGCYQNTDISTPYTEGFYWSSTHSSSSNGYARMFWLYDYSGFPQSYEQSIGYGYNIRPFKNDFTIPDSGWTTISGTLGNAGIFWNQTDGIISITSNGSTGYTMADKNLGATTVRSSGDTLSEANAGKYYQRGNNHGFPGIGNSETFTTTTTKIDASTYGPGNYYDSSTYVYSNNASDLKWDSSNNANLRGGVTQGTSTKSVEVKNIYIGEYGWKPGENTVAYYPFKNNTNDETGNTTLSGTMVQDGLGYKPTTAITINLGGRQPMFIGYWINILSRPTRPSSNLSSFISENIGVGYYLYHVQQSSLIKKIFCFYNSSYAQATASFEPSLNTWHHLAIGYDGTKTIYAIDGVVGTLYNGKGYNFNNAISTDGGGGYYIVSDLISETECWTAQEISDYYNQTKSNYGL